jgi:hypothetical protein
LDPQDALILKHLKDIGAIFDIVVRAPTSTVQFELDTVTDKFLVELYNLDILPLARRNNPPWPTPTPTSCWSRPTRT